MTLGLVRLHTETEPCCVPRPSEPHMFGEGAWDLALISAWEEWEINLKGFPDKRNLSSDTESRRRRAKLGFGPCLSGVERKCGQGSAGKPFNPP